ncbi:cytokinesis protein 3 [Dissophora globulifera]|nr:cytokinesis protein 3 [Dissophora globulifera]
MYAFMAREEGDLTLNKGDLIKVHDNEGGWWTGTLVPDGILGVFPSNFVEILSKFAKRKPVNTQLAINTPLFSQAESENASSTSLNTPSRKNPQAVIGDSGLCTNIPGAFPLSPTSPQSEYGDSATAEITNESVYNSRYAAEQQQQQHRHHQRRNSISSALLRPSGPAPSTLSPAQAIVPKHIANRSSMPNLAAGDGMLKQAQHLQGQDEESLHEYLSNNATGAAPFHHNTPYYEPNGAPGSRSASYLPPGGTSSGNHAARYEGFYSPYKHEVLMHMDRNYSGEVQQPGIMPRSNIDEGHSQPFGAESYGAHSVLLHSQSMTVPSAYGHGYRDSQSLAVEGQFQQYAHQQQPGHRHSIANLGAMSVGGQQFRQQGATGSAQKTELWLENLAKQNRSQGALDQPKSSSLSYRGTYGHGRSRSQANLRPEADPIFDGHHDSQQNQQQNGRGHMGRNGLGPRVPSIIIQPKKRPHSVHATIGVDVLSLTDRSPTLSGTPTSTTASTSRGSENSPTSPGSAESRGTPTTAGTSMSAASAFDARDFTMRKSETARMPISAPMTNASFTARKFSVGASGMLVPASDSDSIVGFNENSLFGDVAATFPRLDDRQRDQMSTSETAATYKPQKPKTTLFRVVQQIINPKKVAEKDAIRNKKEHFAWIEMQKSLKRVSSPEPGLEEPYFPSPVVAAANHCTNNDGDNGEHEQDRDPLEILKCCQVMRDVMSTGGPGTVLDFGPNAFVQVDKVARNVNQRGPQMTPQLLSQKYLTRPYSKSLLFKLRVLFVWVSENIRLEGGPTRDVSGGRYKLGPAGDQMAAAGMTNGILSGSGSPGGSPTLRSGTIAPTANIFMAGIEEHACNFLQEDMPELAQDVLASRNCKTGEGFANLFAEMALAAGIEKVGVVKGYIKGPMDVFSKEVPAPNHAWNVIQIDGTYRFIDCCLASPLHPAHYPSRPQVASSFYFLTSPADMILTHFPVFLTYQYLTPAIPPQIFLQLPFVRPAFFDFGLSLPDFKNQTKLDVSDGEPVEIVVRIDGASGGSSSSTAGVLGGTAGAGHIPGVLGGDCLGRRCGEGIEVRAEVEVMTAEGKVIKKRALAQVMIWNPYNRQSRQRQRQRQQNGQGHGQGQGQLQPSPLGPGSSSISVSSNATSGAAAGSRPHQSHYCTGIRIVKIKAVLPSEAVVGPGGIRKGVIHVYAGRKVKQASSDAMPYALALTLPIRHAGEMPKTPFSFVLPHFSPYEFYVKAPQAEILYYPHTYKFNILSLAAQAQATAVSANAAMSISESNGDGFLLGGGSGTSSSANSVGSATVTAAGASPSTSPPRHLRSLTGGSTSMNPMLRSHMSGTPAFRGTHASSGSAQSLAGPYHPSHLSYPGGGAPSGMGIGSLRGGAKNYPYQHMQNQFQESSISMASTSSLSMHGSVVSTPTTTATVGGGGGGGMGVGSGRVSVPRPERLVLRTQTNRTYKLVYDPVRQCHEAQVEIKERGIWECVRMDDGGKSRVGREGAGGVVIASWKCV